MARQEGWQLAGRGPEHYERFKVPSMHAPVAMRLLEHVPLRPGHRVLDVACGTGIVARLAAPRVSPSGSVTGLDLNKGMLAVARKCAEEAGLPIEWRNGDASALPFEEGAFDVVLCQQGLQFFPDKVGALREMQRVAVRGGMLALSVFAPADPYRVALAEALSRYAGVAAASTSLAPYSLGDQALLRKIASDAALGEIQIRTVALDRRVEPTQEWLLRDTGGMPYGDDIAKMDAATRAEMIRGIAARLGRFWKTEGYSVPQEVHLVYARK